MKKIKFFLYFISVAIIIVACKNNNTENSETETEFIEVTTEQFKTNSMQLGQIETKVFENTIKCNGTVIPMPNAIAKISVPLNGIVKNIKCFNGQQVDYGQVLIEIAGNEIIELQKEFAEASAIHNRLKREYERIKALYNEKVASEKEFTQIESEFKASLARYSALKLKIQALELNPTQIENGEFYSSYLIKSPMKGYIANLKTSIGSYIDSQTEIMEIINPEKLQLKLAVFTNDITNLKKGQTIYFKQLNSNEYQEGTITSVGVVVDNDTKSIPCYASINNNLSNMNIVNSYIEGKIVVSLDTANVVPATAIMKNENKNFILLLKEQRNDKYIFEKQPVMIGREFKDYFEILDELDKPILVKGAYYFEER